VATKESKILLKGQKALKRGFLGVFGGIREVYPKRA